MYFCAPSPAHYRYRFRTWGIKKRTTTKEKESIISAYGKRLRPGSSLSQISIHEGDVEKKVDKKALKRYIGDTVRRENALGLYSGM